MRVLLTGGTGFVGSEVLTQLLAAEAVTCVTCLTRRPIAIAHRKLVSIEVDDFTRYDPALLAQLSDHVGCIWALGGKASDFPDPITYERVTHGFALALASALLPHLAADFSFCYVSGMGADRDEQSRVRWQKMTRHLKGRTERDLLALAASNPRLRVHCFRPGGILPRGSNLLARVFDRWIVPVDVLARALVRVATRRGGPAAAVPATIENRAIRLWALPMAAGSKRA